MTHAVSLFQEALPAGPTMLELGTKRSDPDRPTHHQEWAPDGRWVMSDIDPGLDVDVVADAHQLPFADGTFDGVVAASVMEHLSRPWLAAPEMLRVLKPGGVVFVQTHQTFPIHGYPSDYFRFTTEALRVLFEEGEILTASYEYPCSIVPEAPEESFDRGWNSAAPAWLNVSIVARRGE